MIDAQKASTLRHVTSLRPADLVVLVSEEGVPETSVIAAGDLFSQLLYRVPVPPSLLSSGLPGQYAMDDTWLYTYFGSRWQKLRRDGVLAPKGWMTKTAAYQLLDGDRILADTSAGSFSLTLPATATVGAEISILDIYGSWNTHNLTVLRNGHPIAGVADDLACDVANGGIKLVYAGGSVGWKVEITDPPDSSLDSVSATGNWMHKTSAYTLIGGDKVMADSRGGSFPLLLPTAPAIGAEVEIMDPYSSWETHPVTLARNGQRIVGIADNILLQVDGTWLRFVFVGDTVGWKLNDKF